MRIRKIRDLDCGDKHIYLELEVRRVQCSVCGKVKTERLEWLAKNPHYTRRFAMHVGKMCREQTVSRVANLLRLDWDTVKDLEKQYLQKLVDRAGTPAPRAIGIDEISIRKGHVYRIVVSDLDRRRPIWIGGTGRKEADLEMFFAWLGPRKTAKIRLAVMDMWKPFTNVIRLRLHIQIIYDQFHIVRHLNDAIDEVRRQEYFRLSQKDRRFIKGQRYTLLTHWNHLGREGRKSLQTLFDANTKLFKAYLLKESFGNLWTYQHPGWARKFFDNWKEQLRWQRLGPLEKFAAMVERHWDGIVSYSEVDNKVSLGFVEGANNKIRVIQRRAYGLRDEEYLRLKILASFLPES
jgi:transposase